MPVDKSDLEAIKAAIIAAINNAGGVSGGTTGASAKEAAQLQKYIELLEKKNDTHDKEALTIARMRDEKKKQAAEEQLAIKRLENTIDLNNARIKQMEGAQTPANHKVIAAMKEQNEELEKSIEKIQEDTEAREKSTKKIKEQEEAYKSLKGQMSGMVALYGKHSSLNVENAISMGKQIAKAGPLKAAQAGLVGMATGLIDTIINLTLEMDKSSSAIMKQTGFVRQQASAFIKSRKEMALMGVGVSDLAESVISLQPTFTNFTMLSEDLAVEIAETGALLAKSGVGLEDYGKGLQIATKSLGMGGAEAMKAVIELDGLARQIGVAPKQMAADFSNAGDMVSKFGSDGVRVFKDLAIVSKTTGLSIDKLIRITENFDTFEGAATQAGRLNAALGGNFVNAMDLLMATEPAERFGQIRDAILKTGKTFDSMSYFEKNFYVDSIDGIDNVTDLAMLLSGNMDDLAGATDQSAQSLIEHREKIKAQQDIMEKLMSALRTLIPDVLHFVDALHEVVDALDKGTPATSELGKTMVSLVGSVKWLAENFKWLGIAMLSVYGVKMIAGIALWSRQMGVTKVLMYGTGQVAALTGKQLLAMGAAALLIGVGIGAAAVGIAELAKAFKGMGLEAIGAVAGIVAFGFAMKGMIAAFAALAPASATAAAGLIPFGAGIALVGAGIGGAAAGMGYLAEGMSKMFRAIDVAKLAALGKFMLDSGGLTGGIGNIIGGGGLAAMAAGIYLIGEALESIPRAAVELLTQLSDIEMNVKLAPLTGDVEEMMKSIDAVSAVKLAATALIVQGAAASAAAPAPAAPVAAAPRQETPKFEVTVLVDGVVSKAVTHSVQEVDRTIRNQGLGLGNMPKRW